MELRLLRYFVAVAEQCSLTNAAERRLHTAQPSLSRQIRDLELEIGVKLLERKARGIAISDVTSCFSWHNEAPCGHTPRYRPWSRDADHRRPLLLAGCSEPLS